MALGRTDRLLRRTRGRLFVVTLVLLTLLVVGIGAATAIVGLRTLDADVDRALEAAVDAQVTLLNGELPTAAEGHEADEQRPAAADTVVLVLDPSGGVLQNRSGVRLTGLPSLDALTAAGAGSEVRTLDSNGTSVRVRTTAHVVDGAIQGYVQGAFVLTLHEEQSRSLMITILVVGGLGLMAAALITLLVTGRALVPIREGFEAQRRFVADASHELRTPAALIRANAEVLEREGLVGEGGRDLLGDIIGEADRLAGLVGDLLQLAAWDETRLAVVLAPVDVAAAAADTVRGASALAAERDVRLVLDVPDAPVIAAADRPRLVQLLLILLDNAIDHSPSGGAVTVRVAGAADGVRVDVADEGPGIPEAERERIFAPFTRLAGTTRHGTGGTGLGLAIARRIVEAHGGSIGATSPATGGALFSVRFPPETRPTA
ncbi:MAG: HAMP domain-containing sensor histidine kinase [Candidatus Limnocylindrales bacterium]